MAEVAGVVLSAVPIVLGALKQYETLCKICKRFKQYKNGIDRLMHRLQIQQVIFQNETELLLKGALGSDKAALMIQDLAHSHWQDPNVEDRVNRFLGKSKLALTTAGQQVAEKMKSFADQLEGFALVNAQSDRREWKKEIRKRFRFTFSEDSLIDVADSIATLTAEYRTLRSQLHERAIHEPEPETDLKTRQLNIERIRVTRAAAQRIYEVLAGACQFHQKHHAQFSLRPRVRPQEAGIEIKFHIAYRHLTIDQGQSDSDAIWFEVKSMLCETISTVPRPLSMQQGKSNTMVTIQGTIQAPRKTVRFQQNSHTSTSDVNKEASSSILGTVETPIPSLPDLVEDGEFCQRVRACCREEQSTGKCIGMLENTKQWQHKLYPSTAPANHSPGSDVETLSTLLTSAQKGMGWNYGISPIQRLQLAKLLSTAILNLHATPWMQSSWKSNDIFLYGVDYHRLNLLQDELDAFIEVDVDKQSNSISQPTPDILAPFVRNSTLFSLGVMLIELAFEKPLQDLVTSYDHAHSYATPEYHASMRLSKEVSARMSARYGKIVEQCLLCAFGHGTELENPSLQSAIHKDVVMELDRLATDFQQLVLI